MKPQEISTLLTWKKFALLGVVALVLSLSLFMSIFAPLPIALAGLLYGRLKGSVLIALGLAFLGGFGAYVSGDYSALIIFLYASVIAVIVTEIVKSNQKPSKLFIQAGIIIFTLIMGACAFWISNQELAAFDYIEQEIVIPNVEAFKGQLDQIAPPGSSGRQDLVSILSNTEYITKEVITNFPFVMFAFLILSLWLNGYLLLKGRRLMLGSFRGVFSEFDLLMFRVPDIGIFAIIGSLIMVLWGKDFGYSQLPVFGMISLKCLGVLYFLQGFGVMIQVLALWKVKGFLKIAILALVLGFANWLLAALGLFDMWFDFRKKVFLGLQNKK